MKRVIIWVVKVYALFLLAVVLHQAAHDLHERV